MKKLRRMLLLLAILVLIPLFGFVGFLFTMQARLILPGKIYGSYEKPDAAITPYESLTITAPDGTQLHGVLLRATAPSSTLVLAFPGNTHDAVAFAVWLKKNVFTDPSYAVAAVSYRGYRNILGTRSEGTANQTNLYADGETLYDTLNTQLKPQHISIVGYSIGTTVAVHLATVRPVYRMALLTPIASVRRIAKAQYPWLPINLLLRNPFPTEDIIGQVKTPTTIFYTETDGLIPAEHITKILHAANPAMKLIALEGATHTTILSHAQAPSLLRDAMLPK